MGADALKRRRLSASGFGLVGSALREGHRLILVINGHKSERKQTSEGVDGAEDCVANQSVDGS
jgi:D-alanyl-D-alanine carboxypeptidase (penicillin-binding protein 5/6)